MSEITPDQLAEWKRLCEAASRKERRLPGWLCSCRACVAAREFIAAADDAVPALIEEVERLRAANVSLVRVRDLFLKVAASEMACAANAQAQTWRYFHRSTRLYRVGDEVRCELWFPDSLRWDSAAPGWSLVVHLQSCDSIELTPAEAEAKFPGSTKEANT